MTAWRKRRKVPVRRQKESTGRLWKKSGTHPGNACALRSLWRQLGRRLHHFIEQLFEIVQSGGRHNDGVPAAADVLGDAQEPAPGIFLEREDEGLAFNLNLFGFQSVLVDRRLGLPKRAPPVWRWPFV